MLYVPTPLFHVGRQKNKKRKNAMRADLRVVHPWRILHVNPPIDARVRMRMRRPALARSREENNWIDPLS